MFTVSLLLNGLVLGSVLLLASLGLTLIYGVGRIVNFAHGALFSLGAMCGVWLARAGFPFWPALLLTPVLVGLAAVAVDKLVLSRIRDRPMVDSLLLTFGLSLLITGLLYEFGGGHSQVLHEPAALGGLFTILGVPIPIYRAFLSLFAVVLTAGLLFVLMTSRWGLRVRAANDDAEMAACLGINRETLMHSVVGVSAALVAVAGYAAAPIFNAYATVGDKILILAFMTVILGGLGSLRGAIAAAYVVGLVIVFGEAMVGGQAALLALFLIVMIMLLKWPRGIFGEGRAE